MLRLNTISISGFKSFAEKAILPLSDDITIIVGPNGCGKSNLLDAIAWAMGEQSAKSLRGTTMHDLIFNGTYKKPALGMAEVTLNFEFESGSEKKDIVVGRRLCRTGESDYLLNGMPVRLKDIQDSLRQYGLNPKGYFMIEQSKVDEILTAKAEDRRIVFEDAAEISQFKENKRSATLKLEAARANLLRVNDILSEVEREMETLKRQASKARRFIHLQEEIRETKKRYLGLSLRETKRDETSLLQECEITKKEQEKRSAILIQREAEESKFRFESAGVENNLKELRELVFSLQMERNSLEQGNKHLSETILSSNTRIREIDGDLKLISGRKKDLSTSIDTISSEFEQLSADFKKAMNAQEIAESSVRESDDVLRREEANVSALREESLLLSHRIASLKARRDALREDLERHRDKLKKRKNEAERVELNLRVTIKKSEETKKNFDEIEDSAAAARSKAVNDEEIFSTLTKNLTKMENNMDDLEKKRDLAEARLSILKKQEISSEDTDIKELLKKPELIGSKPASNLISLKSSRGNHIASLLSRLSEAIIVPEGSIKSLLDFLRKNPKVIRPFLILDENDKGKSSSEIEEFLNIEDKKLISDLPAIINCKNSEEAYSKRGKGIITTSHEGIAFDNNLMYRPEESRASFSLKVKVEIGELQNEIIVLSDAHEKLLSKIEILRDDAENAKTSLNDKKKLLEGIETERVKIQNELNIIDAAIKQIEREKRLMSEEESLLRAEEEDYENEILRIGEELSGIEGKDKKTKDDLEENLSSMKMSQKLLDKNKSTASDAKTNVAVLKERRDALNQRLSSLKKQLNDLLETEERLYREKQDKTELISKCEKGILEGDNRLREILVKLDERSHEEARLNTLLTNKKEELTKISEDVKKARESHDEILGLLHQHELSLSKAESEISHICQEISESLEVDANSLSAEFSGSPELEENELTDLQQKTLLLEKRAFAIGPVNMIAATELEERENRYDFLKKQKDDIEGGIASLEDTIRKIQATTKEKFMDAFTAIGENFSRIFKETFLGGNAYIKLTDESNVLESGIEIYAEPPGKKLQALSLLSGGERAMVALSLLFAVFSYHPQSIFILDEVDAPLDEASILRFCRLLRGFMERTQLIISTHNKRTMEELGNIIFGITMSEPGISQVLSLKVAGKNGTAAALGIG